MRIKFVSPRGHVISSISGGQRYPTFEQLVPGLSPKTCPTQLNTPRNKVSTAIQCNFQGHWGTRTSPPCYKGATCLGGFLVGVKWQLYKSLLFCLMFRPNNMIAQSRSGTGKTAAFVLSMLSRVDATKNFPQVLFRFTSYMFLPPAQLVKKSSQIRWGTCKRVKR